MQTTREIGTTMSRWTIPTRIEPDAAALRRDIEED
jgi:hypothetical protein